jgi:CheY-like chemotaxis protein
MTPEKTTLLVVDDEELICRVLLRDFRNRFDKVLFATRLEEAERILESVEVTDLVCDYNLGEAVPRGTELLEKWRKAYPQIERAVIYTGTDTTKITPTEWIDSTVSKDLPLHCLLNALLGCEGIADAVGGEPIPCRNAVSSSR